jgi:YegS/Rv2252/BmrU family lipid kinase
MALEEVFRAIMAGKRFVLIVNPRSGKRRGLALLAQVQPLFSAAGAEVTVFSTTHTGHAGEIARSLHLTSYDGLCLLGGDGIVHEVVDSLMRLNGARLIPLGIIPAGTGNAVSRHLDCTEPIEAVRHILAGRTVPLDVLRVSTAREVIYCVNQVGWGVVADITATAEKLRWLGRFRYAGATLLHMAAPKRRHAKLLLDGKTTEDNFLFVLAANQKYVGYEMMAAPKAHIADGKTDVLVLRKASRLQMLRLFMKVFDGSHLDLDCTEYCQVHSFAVTTSDPSTLELDGEIKGTSPVTVDVVPSAMRVFADPARIHNQPSEPELPSAH